jgi:hypothetical protein
MNTKKSLWFLTEERPKKEVIKTIFDIFSKDYNFNYEHSELRIIPIIVNDKFTFTYKVFGIKCSEINSIYIKTVSGNSSFVDFLIFYQEKQPISSDVPIYAIEETKTDDKESRNTGVYQRCSKFVYIKYYFPKVKMFMLYNLQIEQKKKPTDTYIFGTRLLITFGVIIVGKKLDTSIFTKFENIDEVVFLKEKMKIAPKGNVPILIHKLDDRITISGRLIKSNRLSHDPNIGALSIISAIIRKLGWEYKIIITKHGLSQIHLTEKNKFIKIANKLNIEIDNLIMPSSSLNDNYWEYDNSGEKNGTIFLHLVLEEFGNCKSIFENHAGCEKGYFITKDNKYLQLGKYKDRDAYKNGDKDQIIHIPDSIIYNFDENEVINIEGKKYKNKINGILELGNYDFIEQFYIKKYYKDDIRIKRTVVLFGGSENEIIEFEVGFLLNENGKLILGLGSPLIFKKAIKQLNIFWQKV